VFKDIYDSFHLLGYIFNTKICMGHIGILRLLGWIGPSKEDHCNKMAKFYLRGVITVHLLVHNFEVNHPIPTFDD
jgi:hypothetical protein